MEKKNEEFLASFELTYWISEQRIQGETVRLLKSYPHPWQLFVLTIWLLLRGPECIKTFDEKPSYKELESLLVSRGLGGGHEHHRSREARGAVQRDVGSDS